MKKVLAILLVLAMTCGMFCTSAFAEGTTVTKTANGFGGEISVTITVEDGKVTDASVIGEHETVGVGGRAVELLPKAMVEAGSVDVDALAGASFSSGAILSAARAAYDEAVGASSEAAEIKMAPGTYEETVWGYSQAWPLPVSVTVSEDSIVDIKTPDDYMEHGETVVIFQTVIDNLIPRILENQSYAVDAICGATVSSNAVKQAVKLALADALEAGGSDASAIEQFNVVPPKTEEGEVEEITVDILAVGLGNAGIMASKRAVEKLQEIGAPVSYLGIDKAAKIGGQSAMAHELFIVNPKRLQEEMNEGNDYMDGERLRQYWLDYNKGADGEQKSKEDLVNLYVDRSGELLDWLHFEQGFPIESPKVGDLSKAASEESFLGTFNIIKFDLSYETRRSAVLELETKIMDEVCAAGGSYMLETEGYELLYDEETGSICGAKARNLVTGKEYIIHSDVVILSTGGFGGGDLTETLYSNDPYPMQGRYRQFGFAQNDGKMIQAALDIGAGTWNIDTPGINTGLSALGAEIHGYPVEVLEKMNNRTGRMDTRSVNDIPEGFISYKNVLYVGPNGNRLYNEYNISSSIGNEPNQYYWAGATYFVILDESRVAQVYNEGFPEGTKWRQYTSQGGLPTSVPQPLTYEVMDTAIKMGLVFKADTIEELAEAFGADPATFRATFDRYNELCAKGVDEDFGKDPSLMVEYGEGPYYAVQAYPYPYGSCGGLDVDTQIRVLKEDHETPIYGLYACGGDSIGVIMNNEKNYNGLGGPANGWTYLSGYLAGESVAQYLAEIKGF